jgi:hypothetical protein
MVFEGEIEFFEGEVQARFGEQGFYETNFPSMWIPAR